jgi:hypothetical protein
MNRTPGRAGPRVAIGFALAMIVGAIALFIVAGMMFPTDAHHGDALDAFDGFDKLIALAAAAGAFVLLLIGAFVLRAARKALRQDPPAPPPPPGTALPTARAREARRAPR